MILAIIICATVCVASISLVVTVVASLRFARSPDISDLQDQLALAQDSLQDALSEAGDWRRQAAERLPAPAERLAEMRELQAQELESRAIDLAGDDGPYVVEARQSLLDQARYLRELP